MEHALYFPKDCGKFYKDEPDKSVVLTLTEKLLPEEEKSEFAKYYHLGACPPSAETLKTLEPGVSLSQEDAFMPEEYAENMIGKSTEELKNGVCVMENGVGYVALRTFQEGVNDENMQYFSDNFVPKEEDMFYKTWCPGEHIRLYPDMAIENMGWGFVEVRITDFFGKNEFGLPEDLEAFDPAIIDFQAMNIEVLPLCAPEAQSRSIWLKLMFSVSWKKAERFTIVSGSAARSRTGRVLHIRSATGRRRMITAERQLIILVRSLRHWQEM